MWENTAWRPDLPNWIEFIFFLAGLAAAFHAVMSSRSAQGTIAWAIFCLTFPILGAPLYAIFGLGKLSGYVEFRRRGQREIHHVGRALRDCLRQHRVNTEEVFPQWRVLEDIGRLPVVAGNQVQLYREGVEAFAEMFAAIDQAQDYVLLQFYIWRHDGTGQRLRERLLAALERGVKVYLIYDQIGSFFLRKEYLKSLEAAGAEVAAFGTARYVFNPFRLNFRNHRKILIIDGKVAFSGGLNIGDEYVHRSQKFGFWRDTHFRIEGPAALAVQVAFVEDWYWARQELLKLPWKTEEFVREGSPVLVIPSAPVEELEVCNLTFLHLIQQAKRRIWISSPYFVPDEEVLAALQLAALRGVEVLLLLPDKPDKFTVYLSSFYFLDRLHPTKVRVYRYTKGFLHSKAVVIDDDAVMLGTANLDNRSLRINFEIMFLFPEPRIVHLIEAMFLEDLKHARRVPEDEYRRRPWWFRLAVRIMRLMAPVQ